MVSTNMWKEKAEDIGKKAGKKDKGKKDSGRVSI